MKQTPFCRRHFQVHFLEWKCIDFDQNFTEIYSQGFNQQHYGNGSDNGLLFGQHQAIIWTNDDYFTDIYASLSLNERRHFIANYHTEIKWHKYASLALLINGTGNDLLHYLNQWWPSSLTGASPTLDDLIYFQILPVDINKTLHWNWVTYHGKTTMMFTW